MNQYWTATRRLFAFSTVSRIAMGLVVALVIGFATESLAVPITVPAGLTPGDEYRLVFVSAGTRRGHATDITAYNNFISTQANSSLELADLGTSWSVIASTSTVSAAINTGTAGGGGVPLYLLDGTKIADDYGDLWDGDIDAPFSIDQFGNATSHSLAWSGTNINGTSTGRPLGASSPHVASTSATGAGWSRWNSMLNTNQYPLLGISDVLTVPEPSAGLLVSVGLFTFWLCGGKSRAESNSRQDETPERRT